jgi:hypothetical protein
MALPKPDPSRYRGGSRSRYYREDLAAWEAKQKTTPDYTVQPVGAEEVVSLASSFDEETDPFAVEYGAGSGYRGEPSVKEEEEEGRATGYRESLDPFDSFAKVFISGSDLGKVDFLDDPEMMRDAMESSYLPYIEYDDEMMADLYFQTSEELFRQQAITQAASGSAFPTTGRRLGGDPEEYERAYYHNQMISRGVDPETARDWYDSDESIYEGRELLASDFLEKKENFTSAMDNLRKEDMSAFQEKYEELDFGLRVSYLQELEKRGEIEKENYESAWRSEWNLSQKDSENPYYIIEAPAPAAVPAAGVEEGEMTLIAYRPNNPNSWSVVSEDTYYIPETEAQYNRENVKELQYYDNLRVKGDIPPIEYSKWNDFRDGVLIPGVRTLAAIVTSGKSEQLYSAVRLATGKTLHGSDYANLVIGGLEQAGIITPPTDMSSEWVNSPLSGTVGQQMADNLLMGFDGSLSAIEMLEGVGLGGLTYNQTTSLISAIGDQDVLGAALALEGNTLISDNLEAIGIPPALANDPDFIEGTKAALETAIAGGDFQDALEDGLVEYITEGGGFGGVPDIDVGDLSSVLDPIVEVVQNVGDALEPIFDGVEDVAQIVGDVVEDVIIDPADDILDLLGSEVVDPILQAVEPIAAVIEDVIIDPIDDALDYVGSEFVDPAIQAAEDVAQEVGDVIEDYVVDPVDDVLDFVGEEIVDPVAQTIGDVAEDVVQTTGDVVEDVAQVIGDAVEEGVVDPVDDVLDYIGEEFVDPALQAGEDALQVTGDVLEDIGQSAGDIIEDVAQDTGAAVEDVAQVVGDVVEDAGQVVGDVVETVVDAIPEVDLPSIDLPNINLNLPQITMPSFMASPRAGTRTTDTLFKDMLQFETEITAAPQIQRLGQQPLMPVAQVPTAPVLPQTNILGQFLQPTQATQRRPQGLLTGRRV